MRTMITPSRWIRNQQGLSLVEIMIALVMASIIMVAIYTSFDTQSKTFSVQEQVAEMQQNARMAAYLMARDIRMAGYDPDERFVSLGVDDFDVATATAVTFNTWDDSTNSVDTIAYTYDAADLTIDKNGTAIAEGIDALGFAYCFDSGTDGVDTYTTAGGDTKVIWAVRNSLSGLWFNLDVNNDGQIDENDAVGGVITGISTGVTADADREDIRGVKFWILARTEGVARGFTNPETYTIGTQVISPADNVPRRVISMAVQGRNLNL